MLMKQAELPRVILTGICRLSRRNGWQTGCVIRKRKHQEYDFML